MESERQAGRVVIRQAVGLRKSGQFEDLGGDLRRGFDGKASDS